MKRALKIIVIVVAVVGLGLAGYVVLAGERQPKAPDYQVVPVQRETILAKVSATGSVAPKRQVNLTFKGSGRVAEIRVEAGQYVQEGELLARLDARELELSLEQARVGLEISKAQLAQVEAGPSAGEIAAAKASVASAQAAYERTARGPSAEDIASAQATLESAKAALRKLQKGPTEQEITIAKANLEQARIALEQAQAAYDKVAWIGGVGALPQALQLQQATINYEAALANYELATQGPTESQLKAAEAQVAQAQSALERLLQSPTESELALAEAQVVQAQANLDRLLNTPTPEQLAIAQQQVRQAEIAVAQAQLALDGTKLVAPFSGVIVRVHIELGEMAPLGQPAMILADLSEYHVDVNVDELDVIQVEEGQEAHLILDALPGVTLLGHVDSVSPVPATSVAGGVVSYMVRVTIDEPDPRLKAGMTVNVDIITAKHTDVLTVPNRAIRIDRQTGRAYVEKLVNNTPVEVEITIGLRGEQVTEVLSGLSDGDQVVIRTVSTLERLQRTMTMGF